MKRILPVLLLCCSVSAMALVPPRDPSRRAEWQEQLRNRSGIAKMPAAEQAVGQRTMIPRILVIMANFTDYELVSSAADVDSMFNAVNWTKDGATGSVRQYFYDQSMGQYNPQFDIVGPVTLSNGYAYYGGGCKSTTRAGYMVTEACALVDEQVDFTEYDSNNDGKVDLVYVFFAGFGENDPPTTDLIPVACNLPWPHYWNVVSAGYGSNPREFDGKKIYNYEISNELDGYYSTTTKKVISGIGVLCHEFGHALGLPDTYSTGSGAHNEKLLGSWDIMCYGPYNNDMHTPPSYTAYERFYMGWLTPELITKGDTLTLENVAQTNKAYLICETDTHNLNGLQPDPETFYLLENKQRTGWDIGVPGSGLMLTRIHYRSSLWSGNMVNNDPSDLGIDLIEADGLTPAYNIKNPDNGYDGKPGDLFPAGATEYTAITDHAITDITMTDGIIRFVYRGGKKVDPPTGVSSVVAEQPVYKTLTNGQLLIHSNGHIYSVYGVKQDN